VKNEIRDDGLPLRDVVLQRQLVLLAQVEGQLASCAEQARPGAFLALELALVHPLVFLGFGQLGIVRVAVHEPADVVLEVGETRFKTLR